MEPTSTLGVDMRRFSLLSVLGLVLTVLVAVLGPAGVAAAAGPPAGAAPQNHEPCDPDSDNDCDPDAVADGEPCDEKDKDCTRDEGKGEEEGDQDPCDPDDNDCTPDDAKKDTDNKDDGKGDGKDKDGDAKKCDPDDKDCDSKDPGDEGDNGDGALTDIVKNLLDR